VGSVGGIAARGEPEGGTGSVGGIDGITGGGRRVALQPRREAVAFPRDGCDRLRAECLAQGADLHLEVVLLHHQPRPGDLEQLVLGDQPVAAFYQRHQHIERPRPERYRSAVGQQLPRGRDQLEPAELVWGVQVRPRETASQGWDSGKSTPTGMASEGFSHVSAA